MPEQENNETILASLNTILKDQMTYAVQYMQFHFRALLQNSQVPGGIFKSLAVSEMKAIEAIATRVILLGGYPPKQLDSYGVPENDRDMLHEVIKNEEQIIKAIKTIFKASEEVDPESRAVLEHLLHEKESRLQQLEELL